MSNLNQNFRTSVFFSAPSMAQKVDIDWAKLGINSSALPSVQKRISPLKLSPVLVKEFGRIQKAIYNYLNRYGLKVHGVTLVAPWRLRELSAFMADRELEWHQALIEANKAFDNEQAKVWAETCSDPAIVDAPWRDKYLSFVKARMPARSEFVARHSKFEWSVVPFYAGAFDMEGYEETQEGLAFISEGAIGTLIGEIAAGAASLLEKVENGNVQNKSQEKFLALIDKIGEFSFLNPRCTDVANELLKRFKPLLQCNGSINQSTALKQITNLLKPLQQQHHMAEVLFEGGSLYGEIREAHKSSAEAVIEKRQAEIEAQSAASKAANAEVLKQLRASLQAKPAAEADLISFEESKSVEAVETVNSETDSAKADVVTEPGSTMSLADLYGW